MRITIAGVPGAGKTTLAKALAERLGMKYYSAGDLQGRTAIERGITIDELNALGEDNDRIVDEYQRKVGATEDDIILEGWISWFLIPDSFKILMTIDPDEGARRIYEAKLNGTESRDDERAYSSVEDTKETLAKRVASHRNKFKKLYGVEDFTDPTHFDFVMDTTRSSSTTENADRIIAELRTRGLLK